MGIKILLSSGATALVFAMAITPATAQSVSDTVGVDLRVKFAPRISIDNPGKNNLECTASNTNAGNCGTTPPVLCFKSSVNSINVSISPQNDPKKNHFALISPQVPNDFIGYNFQLGGGGTVFGSNNDVPSFNWAISKTRNFSLNRSSRGELGCDATSYAFNLALSFVKLNVPDGSTLRTAQEVVDDNELGDNVERTFSDVLTITFAPDLVGDG